VPPSLLRTLLALVEVFRPALTRPGYKNALVVFVGWVRSHGRRAITEALVATDVARRRHHERFHRFFSRGAWNPDAIGKLLFDRLLRWVPAGAAVLLALDDTLTPKKGPHVFGIGNHLDAVRSTRRFKVFTFGHVWVVLSVVVRFPFSRRPWAIPVLFRIYRNKKDCERKRDPYRKKTELGRELVDLAAQWAGERGVHVAADSAYCNGTLMRGQPPTVTVFGAIRPDAVLTALPTVPRQPKVGRRPVRGKLLPKPEALARNQREPWRTCTADLYGKQRRVHYKTIDAQWYTVRGPSLLRVVVVRALEGAIGFRVFVCTDPTVAVVTILETYAGRWALEVTFRDLKQQLGFADSCARKRAAVERTTPFVGYIYTTLILWFAETASSSPVAAPPIRPWYRHKRGFSFADILRAAQRVLSHVDVLDPARSLANLEKSGATRPTAADRRRAKAHEALARAA
jgi:DDE superfamily endonuclease